MLLTGQVCVLSVSLTAPFKAMRQQGTSVLLLNMHLNTRSTLWNNDRNSQEWVLHVTRHAARKYRGGKDKRGEGRKKNAETVTSFLLTVTTVVLMSVAIVTLLFHPT